jgi:hypothetical protein
MLSNNIMDYHIVSQGKTSIPGLDDGEECELTDVSVYRHLGHSIKQYQSLMSFLCLFFFLVFSSNLAQKDTTRLLDELC